MPEEAHAVTDVCPAGPIRGRDDVLFRVGDVVAAGSSGRGAVLLIDGPPGCGSSRVLEETQTMARRNGFDVVVVRAVSDLDGVRRLAEQPRSRRLLVTVDDVDRVDPEVVDAVRALSVHPPAAPVIWAVAGSTSCVSGRAGAALGDLLRRGAERLVVGRLDRVDARRLVADLHGAGVPSPKLLEIAMRAEGNPWLLTHLVRGTVTDREHAVLGGGTATVPDRLRDAAEERLTRFAPLTVRLLQVASILGDFAAEHAAAMLELSPAALLVPLQEALRAQALVEADGALRFREALLRDAVLSTLPATVVRGLRRQAADALLDTSSGSFAAAGFLVASAERGDRRAVGALTDAARRSRADPLRSADLASHALRLLPRHDAAWGALVAETTLLLQRALRDDEAQALGAMALDGTLEPSDEAEVRLSLAGFGRQPSASRIDHGQQALRARGLSDAARARHLALLARNLGAAGRLAEASSLLPRARDAADATHDALATALVRLADAETAEAEGRYEQALELAAPGSGRSSSVFVQAAVGALCMVRVRSAAAVGRTGEAARLADAVLAGAELDGDRWLEALCRRVRSRLRLDAGHLGDAIDDVEAARELRPHPTDVDLVLIGGEAALHVGDASRLTAALEAGRGGHEVGDAVVRARASRLLALAAWADGRHGDACAWLTQDGAQATVAALSPLDCPALIRIALAGGSRTLAAAARSRAGAASAGTPSSPLLAASLEQCEGLLHDDAAALQRCARSLGEAGRPLLQAAALEDACVAAANAGRREDAVRCAREAARLFDDCTAVADLRRLRKRLRALGFDYRGSVQRRPKEGWGSLTGAELEVIRLVAEGRTNRQVAERLFLSPHTVSTHLRHAFMKLEINSRVELARIVLRVELDEAVAA